MSTTKRNQAAIGEALLLIHQATFRGYRLPLYNIGQIFLLCLLQQNNEYPTDNIGTFTSYLDRIEDEQTESERNNSELLKGFSLDNFNAPLFDEPDQIEYIESSLKLSNESRALVAHNLCTIVEKRLFQHQVIYACGYIAKRLSVYLDCGRQSIFDDLAESFAATADKSIKTAKADEHGQRATEFIDTYYNCSNLDPLSGVSYESK